MRFDTLAIHAGQQPDPSTGAIMTPVYLTSTYVQDGPGEHKGYEYSRTKNPTRLALEACLRALEGAGDHCVCSDGVYGGPFRLFDKVFRRQGIQYTFADLSSPGALEAALTP